MYTWSMFAEKNPDLLLVQIELSRLAGKVVRVPGAPECFFIHSHAEDKKIFGCFKDDSELNEWLAAFEQFDRCRYGDDLSGSDVRIKYIKKDLPPEHYEKIRKLK